MSEKYFRKAAAQGGLTNTHWNHANPEQDAHLLIPSLIHVDKVELKRLTTPVSSPDAMNALLKVGSTYVEPIAMRHYRPQTYSGTIRVLNNEDTIKGKEPIYDDLDHAKHMWGQLKPLVLGMIAESKSRAEEGSLVASMELQDMEKITMQQWKPPGWHLDNPITDAEVPQLSREALEVLGRVADKYCEVLQPTGLLEKGRSAAWRELIALDSDPHTTMTGSPTFGAGEMTHPARLAMLAAMPVPTGDPALWVEDLLSLGRRLALPESAIISPVLSTRYGPLKKPVPLYTMTQGGYVAEYEAVGAYNRVRFVYPAPYHINFLLSPLYVQMSEARRRIPGFWHSPEMQASYLAKLKQQGKQTYSIDFSGMDKGMLPHIVLAVMDVLKKKGFAQWPISMFQYAYPKMGVMIPDMFGETGKGSMIKGDARPWCSGFKLTSEFDTIYGAAVLLTALSRQRPTVIDEWANGSFVFLELGDDVMFTCDFIIDAEKLALDALQTWGAKLEIIQDAMFLKWFMPVTPEIPNLSKPFSRLIQQTFFNEDRYTGVEGGDRPDALMRLGLTARMIGLKQHPWFDKWWNPLHKIISDVKYLRTADKAFLDGFKAGMPQLSETDVRDILEFSLKNPSFGNQLMERAKFEPSAAATVRYMESLGLTAALMSDGDEIRSAYVRAAFSPPTEASINHLQEMVGQTFM